MPGNKPLVEVPQLTNVPGVQFVDPKTKGVVACIDQQNVQNLLIRDSMIEGHVRKLEAALQNCK